MGRGRSHDDGWAFHPPFSFCLAKKRTGRTRRGYAASVSGTAANGCAMDGPREKTPGAILRVRTSSLKYGDLLRQFRLGEELPYRLAPFRSLAMVWPPRVRFGGNLVGGSGHRFLLVPLALPWCALGRLALSHRRSSGSEKRRKSIRQAATNLPPHPTRGEVSFKCQIPARAGRRCPILVGTHSEDPRIEANLHACASLRPAFFLLTVHGRFLFDASKRKWGVRCQAINIAYTPSHRTAPIETDTAAHSEKEVNPLLWQN